MSSKEEDESLWSLMEGWKGIETGLELILPELERKSIQYFLWHIDIPCLEWATIRPRKYFILPKPLILNEKCIMDFMWIDRNLACVLKTIEVL